MGSTTSSNEKQENTSSAAQQDTDCAETVAIDVSLCGVSSAESLLEDEAATGKSPILDGGSDCSATPTAVPPSPSGASTEGTIPIVVELGDLPLPRLLQFLPPKMCFRVAQLSEQFQRALVIRGKHVIPWLVCGKELRLEIEPKEFIKQVALESVISAWFMGTPDALEAFSEILQSGEQNLKQLQRFSAKGCRVDKATMPLLKHVFASGQITLFNLELNQLGDETVKSLVSELLINNRSLETLCIRSNKIGDEGAKALAALVQHPTLRFLNLKQNSIGTSGASALAKFLEGNTILENLNLRAQTPKLPSSAGLMLARSLSLNGSLRRLRLRRNRMDDAVADALVEPLVAGAARLSLIEVDLQQNLLTVAGGATLARILQKNSVIDVVYVGGHRFGAAEVSAQLDDRYLDERMKFDIYPDV